jgi:IS30 family transposase
MYTQITPEERYEIAALRRQRFSIRAIARELGRSPSTISRELRRNRKNDGWYRAQTAIERTNGRRSRSRRNSRFTEADWRLVDELLSRR